MTLEQVRARLREIEARMSAETSAMSDGAKALHAQLSAGEIDEETYREEIASWIDAFLGGEEWLGLARAIVAAEDVADEIAKTSTGKMREAWLTAAPTMPAVAQLVRDPAEGPHSFDLVFDNHRFHETPTDPAAFARKLPMLPPRPIEDLGPQKRDMTPGRTHNLAGPLSQYDHIVLNSSGGKDSQAMIDVVMERAREEGVQDRVVVVHCDLGAVEWPGTKELAAEQARHYGLRFEVVSRPQGDLLHQIEHQRKKWPDMARRFCTSDQKAGQVEKVFTSLVSASHAMMGLSGHKQRQGRKIKILSVMGIRAQESPKRASMPVLKLEEQLSNSYREIWEYYPLHDWTVDEVWARIRQSGVRHHPAYDKGMPRLSCSFCVLASRDALLLAGIERPDLLERYVEVEKKIGHSFKQGMTIASIKEAIARGERPPMKDGKYVIGTWEESGGADWSVTLDGKEIDAVGLAEAETWEDVAALFLPLATEGQTLVVEGGRLKKAKTLVLSKNKAGALGWKKTG